MPKFTWLRGFGPIGTFIANAIVFLTASWGIVMSAALGIFAAIDGSAYDIANNPHVQVGVGTFVAVLWTYIGFIVIADRRKPRVTRPYQDYHYGLTFEGLIPTYEPSNEEGALQFGIQLRNYSSGPIRYTIEYFDVRIGSRSLSKFKKATLTSFMPRGAGRVSSNMPFKKDDIKEFTGKRVSGTVECAITYGHPEMSPARRLKTVINIVLMFKENDPPQLGFASDIVEESDEPINNY